LLPKSFHAAQNVDGLDIIAGLPKDKSVAVHGSYSSAQCVQCRTIVPIDKFVADLVGKQATPPLCPKPKCRAFLKPSIVMYFRSQLQHLRRHFSK
jgi:NAD-dependent histone deacetylase SIR2